MSKRLTVFSVWGFYVGALAGGVAASLVHIPDVRQIILASFAFALMCAGIGFVLAKHLNRTGWHDDKVDTLYVARETLKDPIYFGFGLPVILCIAVILSLLSYAGLHFAGF